MWSGRVVFVARGSGICLTATGMKLQTEGLESPLFYPIYLLSNPAETQRPVGQFFLLYYKMCM